MNKFDLFKIIIDLDEINTKNLKNRGVSNYFISKFIKENTIERISIGKYEISDIKGLYSYGKKLIKYDANNAIKCLKICIKYNINDIKSYFGLIIANIYLDNYDEVIKYLDILTDKGVIIDNERNYILYLINNLRTLDEKYVNELIPLSFNSIKYLNYEDKNAYYENGVRQLCYNGKYSFAINKQKNLLQRTYMSNFSVIHDLLIKKSLASIKEKNVIMSNLIQQGEYETVVKMLKDDINPNKYYQYVLKLLNEILYIDSTNTLPRTKMVEASNIFEAIDGKNYSLALALSENNNDYNLISQLLNIICNKIKEKTNPTISCIPPRLNWYTNINCDSYDEIEKLIIYIYRVLSKKKGIYILDAFNDKTTYELILLLKRCKDFDVFTINYNLEKRIVVRYSPKKSEDIDINSTYQRASWFYEYKLYNECLELCLKLLQTHNPNADIYALTAYTYWIIGKPQDALKYFIIAYDKTKNSTYLNYILQIEGAYYKHVFKMKEEEFYLNDNFLKKIK